MLGVFRAYLLCSAAMSAVVLLFWALSPLLRIRYGARALHWAWVILALGFLFPVRPRIYAPPLRIPTPPALQTRAAPVTLGQDRPVAPDKPAPSWPEILAGLWLAGAAISLLRHLLLYCRLLAAVKRWGAPCADQEMLDCLERNKAALGLRKAVGLRRFPLQKSAMGVGFFRPVILLPVQPMDREAAALILRHELVHIKRGDLWTKLLIQTAAAAHWFNPVVYLLARQAASACELACDEQVLRALALDGRKRYAALVLEAARLGPSPKGISTEFRGGKRDMKKRVKAMFDTKIKKTGAAMLAVALVASLGAGSLLAFAGAGEDGQGDPPIRQPGTEVNQREPSLTLMKNGDLLIQYPSFHEPGNRDTTLTEDQYQLFLSLMTTDYGKQTVAEFDKQYLELAEQHPSVFANMGYNDQTAHLGYIKSLNRTMLETYASLYGDTAEWTCSTATNKRTPAGAYYGAQLDYSICWEVLSPQEVTIGERDWALEQMEAGVQQTLDSMTRDQMAAGNRNQWLQDQMDQLSAAYSTDQLKVTCRLMQFEHEQ